MPYFDSVAQDMIRTSSQQGCLVIYIHVFTCLFIRHLFSILFCLPSAGWEEVAEEMVRSGCLTATRSIWPACLEH